MKRTFLMPHWCKIAGWVVMVPLVVIWLVYLIDTIGTYGDGMETGNLGRVGSIAGKIVEFSTTVYIILVGASMMMVAFSREMDEDEYVASVRMKSLMMAFWGDFVVLIITALTVYDFDYLMIMSTQMFLILFLHIVIFNVSMAVIRRRRGHEE